MTDDVETQKAVDAATEDFINVVTDLLTDGVQEYGPNIARDLYWTFVFNLIMLGVEGSLETQEPIKGLTKRQLTDAVFDVYSQYLEKTVSTALETSYQQTTEEVEIFSTSIKKLDPPKNKFPI